MNLSLLRYVKTGAVLIRHLNIILTALSVSIAIQALYVNKAIGAEKTEEIRESRKTKSIKNTYDKVLMLAKHISNGLYDKTIEDFRGLIKITGKSYLKIALATSLYKTGKIADAEKIFKLEHRKNPYDRVSNFYLGVINFEKKKYEKSKTFFNNAYLAGFKPCYAKYYLGMINYIKKDYHEAIVDFLETAGKSIDLKQKALFYAALCKINLQEEKAEYLYHARGLLKQSMEVDPGTKLSKTSKTLMNNISAIITEKNISAKKSTGIELSTGYIRDSNLLQTKDSGSANLLGISITGNLSTLIKSNYHVVGLYHNFTEITLYTDPDTSRSYAPSHLFKLTGTYLPADLTELSLAISYLSEKFFTGNNSSEIRASIGGKFEYLSLMTTSAEISVLSSRIENTSSSFAGYELALTQIFHLRNFMPFLRYKYRSLSSTNSVFDFNTDKLIAGLNIDSSPKSMKFLSFIGRTWQRETSSRSAGEIQTETEIYAAIKKPLSTSAHFFINGSWKKTQFKIISASNFFGYRAGTGIFLKF